MCYIEKNTLLVERYYKQILTNAAYLTSDKWAGQAAARH